MCVTIFVCFVQGNVKDFQLWVISKKDNVPYPLIGQCEENAALRSIPIEECTQQQPFAPPPRQYYCRFPSLSGHEFPFSIQMSHAIQTLSPGGEGRDAAVDRQVALQMEQLQVYKQCQFILKRRPTDTQPVPAGPFMSQVVWVLLLTPPPPKKKVTMNQHELLRRQSCHKSH